MNSNLAQQNLTASLGAILARVPNRMLQDPETARQYLRSELEGYGREEVGIPDQNPLFESLWAKKITADTLPMSASWDGQNSTHIRPINMAPRTRPEIRRIGQQYWSLFAQYMKPLRQQIGNPEDRFTADRVVREANHLLIAKCYIELARGAVSAPDLFNKLNQAADNWFGVSGTGPTISYAIAHQMMTVALTNPLCSKQEFQDRLYDARKSPTFMTKVNASSGSTMEKLYYADMPALHLYVSDQIHWTEVADIAVTCVEGFTLPGEEREAFRDKRAAEMNADNIAAMTASPARHSTEYTLEMVN